MLAILTSIIVLVLLFGLISSNSTSKKTKRTSNWHPDDKGGLPWFGNKKRQRKTKRYYWD